VKGPFTFGTCREQFVLQSFQPSSPHTPLREEEFMNTSVEIAKEYMIDFTDIYPAPIKSTTQIGEESAIKKRKRLLLFGHV